MKQPNSESAVIAPEKFVDHLLNTEHKRGGAKARLLTQFGYRAENWQQLESDIHLYHVNAEIDVVRQTMDFKLYTDVVLLCDVPEDELFAGEVGVVVERHDVAGRAIGYSDEFFDMFGNRVAVVTLPGSMLRAPTHADRPAARCELVSA